MPWIRIFVLALLLALPVAAARAQGIVDEWAKVEPLPAPAIVDVTLAPESTALLVLDLAEQTCSKERRPRCIAMLPRAASLLQRARERGWTVVYALGGASTPADIHREVAMAGGEPVVKSGPDKFLGTELEKILRDAGVRTVVVVGAAAHGAVLFTAAGAALRGLDVVVAVDGMASETPYGEQVTAWELANAPRIGERVRLSTTARIR